MNYKDIYKSPGEHPRIYYKRKGQSASQPAQFKHVSKASPDQVSSTQGNTAYIIIDREQINIFLAVFSTHVPSMYEMWGGMLKKMG